MRLVVLKSEESLATQDRWVSLSVWAETETRQLGLRRPSAHCHITLPLLDEFRSKSQSAVCMPRLSPKVNIQELE